MANEKRLIDSNELMAEFRRYMVERYDSERCVSEENCKTCEKSCLWRKIISVAPTVDAVEVVHGRWIATLVPDGYVQKASRLRKQCSVCGWTNACRYRFCPNCGAKMDGGNKDEM